MLILRWSKCLSCHLAIVHRRPSLLLLVTNTFPRAIDANYAIYYELYQSDSPDVVVSGKIMEKLGSGVSADYKRKVMDTDRNFP